MYIEAVNGVKKLAASYPENGAKIPCEGTYILNSISMWL